MYINIFFDIKRGIKCNINIIIYIIGIIKR